MRRKITIDRHGYGNPEVRVFEIGLRPSFAPMTVCTAVGDILITCRPEDVISPVKTRRTDCAVSLDKRYLTVKDPVGVICRKFYSYCYP